MKMTFTGPESGVKAKYSWDSKNKNLGKGYLEIKESVPNEYIILDMCFMENAVSTGKFLFTRDTTNVSVVWTLESDMGKNPLAKYFGLLMDKMVGSDFEKGLNEIKRITEKEYNDELKYPVNEINTDNVCALTMRIQCKQKEISEKMAQGYGELMKTMTEKKLKMSGPPFAIYHAFDKLSGVDMELGLPVNACVRLLKGDISCTNFDAFKAASVNYYGAYEGTVKAHEMIGKWVKKNNKTVIGPPWEIYKTDPGMEKDTSKWLTVIIYPIR